MPKENIGIILDSDLVFVVISKDTLQECRYSL